MEGFVLGVRNRHFAPLGAHAEKEIYDALGVPSLWYAPPLLRHLFGTMEMWFYYHSRLSSPCFKVHCTSYTMAGWRESPTRN